MPQAVPQSPRTRAMLAAVADGRAEVSDSCEPDMFIDGLACCDQALAHTLTHAELIRPIGPATPSGRHAVTLTARGVASLAQQAGPLVGRHVARLAEPMSERKAS
ncbi:hypothetical protein [Haloechinothrix halophila]|uniref:hypothetical protein n=1 Tax=Haloechinothrix halophila TaxID=1069073 RepID=UPI0012FA5EC6|nr:hypothetical protein [Haloechinothrix halophila]